MHDEFLLVLSGAYQNGDELLGGVGTWKVLALFYTLARGGQKSGVSFECPTRGGTFKAA